MSPLKILYVSDLTVSSVIRQEMIARRLHERGHEVYITRVNALTTEIIDSKFDVISFIRPTEGAAEVIAYIRQRSPNTYIITDQDDCFDAIPKHHVAYKWLGKGNPKQAKATRDTMARSNKVIVSTTQLKDYYAEFNPTVIPNGWDGSNKAWEKENSSDGVVIGWAGTITHREDFKLVRDPIRQILAEFPETRILIGNDEEIYRQFSDISPERRLYVPMVPYPDYPLVVRQMHVLLAPLQIDYFNSFKSDIKLVEAGAAKIPFVASPAPNYTPWTLGGMMASSPSEFYRALRCYVMNPDERDQEGLEGHALSCARESNLIVNDFWNPILEEAKQWLS